MLINTAIHHFVAATESYCLILLSTHRLCQCQAFTILVLSALNLPRLRWPTGFPKERKKGECSLKQGILQDNANIRSSRGWRLDIVSLLAVIGESSMAEHSQAMTSSWTCLLPRIIPAPQALLKPLRPSRMPQVSAFVVGVHNGTFIQTLNYFPNIIHPIEALEPFSFKVLEITHRVNPAQVISPPTSAPRKAASASSSVELGQLESGQPQQHIARRAFRKLTHPTEYTSHPRPHVPSKPASPLNVLSVVSFFLTVGLFVWAIVIKDGTACVALGTISLASSIVGYASWWSPKLMRRSGRVKVPAGDVVIRTREGAFILVKCNEDVARELYTGTESCTYYVPTDPYRMLVGIGTFLLMIAVVLLGNCGFTMQVAIGVSYVVLNGAFWTAAIINKKKFWDLSAYVWKDITPPDAQNAQSDNSEDPPSFTRTMWYAIRETRKAGWVKSSGAAPTTIQVRNFNGLYLR